MPGDAHLTKHSSPAQSELAGRLCAFFQTAAPPTSTGVGDEAIEAARTVQRYFMLREAALEVEQLNFGVSLIPGAPSPAENPVRCFDSFP